MSELFLTSRVLPVPHGFSLRTGGVSQGPFASLNLGLSVGDEREHVLENLRRFAAAAGLAPTHLRAVSQVHGDQILEAKAPGATETPEVLGEADAVWTQQPGLGVGVKTADCVPILIADPVHGRVAAVHSGWRGTDQLIARNAVQTLVAQGSKAEDLLCAVGPCIQRCCYEISEELASRFVQKFGRGVVSRPGARPHLDLPAAVRDTLLGAGVRAEHVDVLPHCTSCEKERFFSHRRDQGRTGRHLSFIAAVGPRGHGATRL